MKKVFKHRCFLLIVALVAAMTFSGWPAFAADEFYDKPQTMPTGNHGDLVRYEANAELIIPEAEGISFNAWKVMYLSTDAVGQPNLTTGVVIIPTGEWTGGGSRPVVVHCPGTQGMGPSCATSKQLEAGVCYQSGNIAAGLKEGYAMLVPDYPGYLNRQHPEIISDEYPAYMNSYSEAHAVLDMITAARQLPGSPLRADDRVAFWGFSQGGQAACAAGEQQPFYMPGLNLVTVAAGGVPSDLMDVAYNVDGNVGAGFLMQVFVALAAQYPEEMPIYDLMNDTAEELILENNRECMFRLLFNFMYYDTADLSEGNLSLRQLFAQQAEIAAIAEGMKLGSHAIDAPVYLYHGTADQFIPLNQALDLKDDYCRIENGTRATFNVFPSTDHITVMYQGTPYVMDWLRDRFNNVPLDRTIMCQENDRPWPDNFDPSADFMIPMDEWRLNGWVELGRLDQVVPLPEDSSFSAVNNVTQGKVLGDVTIPPFNANITLLRIPIKAAMEIIPAEQMSADLFVGDNGEMEIYGHTLQDLTISGVGVTQMAAIPFTVNTSEPVDFPLEFVGSVQDLGLGKLKFSGEATVPRMTGGVFAPVFSAIMSGPMPFEYNVFPGPNQEPFVY